MPVFTHIRADNEPVRMKTRIKEIATEYYYDRHSTIIDVSYAGQIIGRCPGHYFFLRIHCFGKRVVRVSEIEDVNSRHVNDIWTLSASMEEVGLHNIQEKTMKALQDIDAAVIRKDYRW